MVVADVGAGEGTWSAALAEAAGPRGHLFATEVEADLVEELEARLAARGIENATVLLGDQATSGLEEGCCDAILLRMVYHHFEDPRAMRASLRDALTADGRLAIVDINPQRHWRRIEGVPDRGGHGIEPDDLIAEMTADGFELVSRHDDWNRDDDRYCIIFRRATSDRHE